MNRRPGPRRPRAFTLLEVLVATALFGLAAAGLLMAFAPTYEALFRLSGGSGDAGDLEVVKALVAASRNRDALSQGGDTRLPDGRKLNWSVELTPTETEALFLVRLTAEREHDGPLAAEYLHFEPNWLLATDEKPRWLAHTGTSRASAQGGGASRNHKPGDKGKDSAQGGDRGARQGRDGSRENRGGGREQGGARPSGGEGSRGAPPASGGKGGRR